MDERDGDGPSEPAATAADFRGILSRARAGHEGTLLLADLLVLAASGLRPDHLARIKAADCLPAITAVAREMVDDPAGPLVHSVASMLADAIRALDLYVTEAERAVELALERTTPEAR